MNHFLFSTKLTISFILLQLMLLSCKGTFESAPVAVPIESKIEKKDPVEILYQLKNPSSDYVLAVSHRGDWRYAPENSLMAIQRCIDIGVDIVEIDVQLTKDKILVAMHDETVDRTTTGKGKLSDLTLSDIEKLSLKNACGIKGSRQKVPTLEEIMLLAKDRIMINLDKTEGKTIREAYVVLKKTGTINQVIFKGNDSSTAMRAKYGTLMDSIIYMPKIWYNLPDISSFVEEYEEDLAPEAYEVIFNKTNSPVVSQIAKMNENKTTVLAIALWDELCAGYTDELALLEGGDASWGELIKLGANAIMTDRPSELLDYLRQRGLHN